MSTQSRRVPDDDPDDDPDDADLVTPTGGVACHAVPGCGAGPQNLARIDAIAITSFLERRFTSLLDHPEHSLRYRGPGRGSWSAMEPALLVSEVLGAATIRLRYLLGEETLKPVPTTDAQGSVPSPQAFSAVLAALAENVRRLRITIAGRRPKTGVAANPMTASPRAGWCGRPCTTLDAASRVPTPRPALGIHSVPALEELGER